MFNPHFDKLLHHLLHVRFLKTHAQHCPGLHREASGNDNWKDRFRQNAFECNDGVLHIPAKHVLLGNYMQASTKEEKELLDSYKYGINVSWPLPCRAVNDVNTSSCYPGTTTAATEACPASTPFPLCFRGVHDNIISSSEVENAIRLGNHLIMKGGDHFDVHYEIAHLGRRVPSIVEKLSRLLRENYNVENLNPVAFRINTVGPMDGLGVNLYRSPANTLNQTVREIPFSR